MVQPTSLSPELRLRFAHTSTRSHLKVHALMAPVKYAVECGVMDSSAGNSQCEAMIEVLEAFAQAVQSEKAAFRSLVDPFILPVVAKRDPFS